MDWMEDLLKPFLEDIPRSLVLEFLCARVQAKILVYEHKQECLFTEDVALFPPHMEGSLAYGVRNILPDYTVMQILCKENPRSWKDVLDAPRNTFFLEVIGHSGLSERDKKFAVMKKPEPVRMNFGSMMLD